MNEKVWTKWLLSLAVLGFLCFLGAGFHQWIQYRSAIALEQQARSLKKSVQEIDGEQDHRKAIRRYLELPDNGPEIQLRILQRQWAMAVEKMARIRNANDVQVLEEVLPELRDDLSAHLSAMAERCRSATAASGEAREEIAWQVRNIQGCVSTMGAFLALSEEKNEKKAFSHLRSAISGFASAMRAVDQIGEAGHLRNVPRWNMALIAGKEAALQFNLAPAADDRRLDLQKNLETVIPETGGYAPGDPAESRIAK